MAKETLTSRLIRLEGKVDNLIENHLSHIYQELTELKTDHRWAGRLAWAAVVLTAATLGGVAAVVAALLV